MSAATTCSQLIGAGGPPPPHASPCAAPAVIPASAASPAQRSASSAGVNDRSFAGRVFNAARSSAAIRSAGDSHVAPALASSASIATDRFENARSCAGLNPTISRVPLRSGPHPTPRRAVNTRCSSA